MYYNYASFTLVSQYLEKKQAKKCSGLANLKVPTAQPILTGVEASGKQWTMKSCVTVPADIYFSFKRTLS